MHNIFSTEEYFSQTEVTPVNQHPIFQASSSFPGVPGDEVIDRIT